MARKIALSNSRGSAVLEAVPVGMVVLVFVMGLLFAAYLMFARGWIQYQGEQALYCVNEARPASVCRRELAGRLTQFLPWGKLGNIDLRFQGDKGKLDIKWVIEGFTIRISKQMSMRQIIRKKGLP
jgi:hypothetical protein